MEDFLAAVGLVFVIEGLVFAAFPGPAKRAMASVMETPEAAGYVRQIRKHFEALLGID